MASAKFPKSDAQLKRMADMFAKGIQIEIARKRKRIGLDTKWEKDGKNWKPVSTTKRTFKGNSIATSNLFESVKVTGSDMVYNVEMADYAKYIISGRKKGKGLPPDVMLKWIKDKRIRPRIGGKFVKVTKNTYKNMAFLMNRKIKYLGIAPFDFVEPARADVIKRFKGSLTKAMNTDLMNLLRP
jgi:hypothetical protein